MFHCELSAQNRIVALSDNWDAGAGRCDKGGPLAQSVMGRPIWDFVAGLETRSYLNALIFAARRDQRRLSVRYRCDGPSERRLYQMLVEPVQFGGVALTHLPLEITAHPVRPQVPEGELACCGQCLRWRRNGTWQETGALAALARSPVDYRVCPDCRAEARRALSHPGLSEISCPSPGIAC